MFRCINSYSMLYMLFAWCVGVCYGFVLLSSATGDFSDANIFKKGDSLKYNFQSTILLNERDLSAKNVGFFIEGEVTVDAVWEKEETKLLKLELITPKLHIRSRKAPSPDGFIPHSSKLDGMKSNPLLLIWNKGQIEKILISDGESSSMKNIQKGIASLFQFQLLDTTVTETDVSGTCTTTYTSAGPTKFTKTKTGCTSEDFETIKSSNKILNVDIQSNVISEYELASNPFYVKSVKSTDSHTIYLSAREEMANHIEAKQVLSFKSKEDARTVDGDNVHAAIDNLGKSLGVTFKETPLKSERDLTQSDDVSFPKKVENLRNHLKVDHLGTVKQAKVFIELVNAARGAKIEELSKVLSSKKNKQILFQLYDVMGYVGTIDSHAVVMKYIHLEKEELIDASERYLWALSLSSQADPDVVKDLLKKFTKVDSIPEKVKETLILTIASMAHKLTQSSSRDLYSNVVRDVEETIINNLDYSKGEDKFKFFRALKNLKSPTTLPVLLGYIKNGTQKEGVLSWKAIKAFGSQFWNRDILITAEKSFFQLDRRYDSSSRTIAADVLLEFSPSDELLEELLEFLISNDPAYEIKQYLIQRIRMLTESDTNLKDRVERIIKGNKLLNNYSGINPRGLSVSLRRSFMNHPSSNGSLVSIQEMKSGISKRGTIDVVIQRGDIEKELFSLGIYSGGLHTFFSSDSDKNDDEEESATAGIELTVLDTQIRPFVFFSGQGELMGHVWSGTASEKTPAFQVLALLHDHVENIRLSSGFIARVNFKGSTSFDLSGKIEISLWNRNADALVQKSAGIVVTGTTTIDTAFVKSQIEFSASVESELDLQTDIDFSSNVHLCMRLTQPEALYRHNIYKVERIPGSKHKMRISKYQKHIVPGRTYSINKKNNEMCNAIFS